MPSPRLAPLVDAARADVVAARTALTVLDDVLWTGDAADGAARHRDQLERGIRSQLAALDEVDSRIGAAWSAAVCTPLPGALPHEGGAPW